MKKAGMIQPSEPWPRPIQGEINIAFSIKDKDLCSSGGFAGYLAGSALEGVAQIRVDASATLLASVENGLDFRAILSENVVHEMLHAFQDYFHRAFDEDEVEDAIAQAREYLRLESALVEAKVAVVEYRSSPLRKPVLDGGKPEPGDLVISASSQAVQWNGLPDPWYWTVDDAIAMQDETIVVIRRAAEIKRRIEEAKE